MSDIGPGDVVVCVADRLAEYRRSSTLVTIGRLYRVIDVYVSSRTGCIGLVLAGVTTRKYPGMDSRLFRKIYPADPAFIERIKRLKVDA